MANGNNTQSQIAAILGTAIGAVITIKASEIIFKQLKKAYAMKGKGGDINKILRR